MPCWTFTFIRWIWYAIFSALRRFFRASLCRLEGTEKLSFEPRPAVAAGIPLEKIGLGRSGTKVLFERNSFSPVLKENPVYTQGFFDEVRDFAQCTQGRRQKLLSSLENIRDTYKLIEDLRKIQP